MKDYRLNPDWYRTKYNLASERLNWAASGDAPRRAKRLELARECARELLARVEETFDDRQRGHRPDAELRDFVVGDIRPKAELLLAEIEVAERKGAAEPDQPDGEGGEDGGGEPAAVATTASTVETVLETAPDTPELNYSIARLYAQAQARDLARKYLDLAVDKTEPNELQALAHRIVRDPVLGDVTPLNIGSAEGFSPMLATAREETDAEAQAGAQGLD
jgi:hypothetical protein